MVTIKLGIISDTHDQIQKIKKAVQMLNKEQVDLLIHCGDICSPFSLLAFRNLQCPIWAVFGNNDADIFKHTMFKEKFGIPIEFRDRFFTTDFYGKKIGVIHGDPEEVAQSLAGSGKFDIVLRGHTHRAEIAKHEETLMINPGNLVGPFDGNDWTKPSFALYDTQTDKAMILFL